jgi:hypothetical protein
MTGFHPGSVDRPHGCRFLIELADGSTECSIRSGDVAWDSLSENVRRYYETNCVKYPDVGDPGHTPLRHSLPEGCGYRMVWVEE